MESKYGLELTNNSKTSWAFSMPRERTCIDATSLCRSVCYGNGIRFQSASQKNKRARNYRTVEFLLANGGPELLAENLIVLLDKVKPMDWLTAKIQGAETETPWTLRIHDVGDFYSTDYVRAWVIAGQARPQCSLWFYTRSFRDSEVFAALSDLASLPNCQGWLSVDRENFKNALSAYRHNGDYWKLALLQENEELMGTVVSEISRLCTADKVVSFPVHRGRYHVAPMKTKALFTCPAVLGIYPLQPKASSLRPCQSCRFCFPSL